MQDKKRKPLIVTVLMDQAADLFNAYVTGSINMMAVRSQYPHLQ